MTTTTHPETQIAADPEVPTITIVRDFNAPPSAVFRAHTDPELLCQWLGPRRLTMRIDRWAARTGGEYRYLQTDEDGSEYAFYGSFHEIRPAERLVQTFTFEGVPEGVCLETMTFEDLGGGGGGGGGGVDSGRTRMRITSVFFSMQERDMAISSGMETGVVEGYEQLDDLLAGSAPD